MVDQYCILMGLKAHPHVDYRGKVAVVQHGILENYSEIKTELEENGHVFDFKTDTEVIAHLIKERLREGLSRLFGRP